LIGCHYVLSKETTFLSKTGYKSTNQVIWLQGKGGSGSLSLTRQCSKRIQVGVALMGSNWAWQKGNSSKKHIQEKNHVVFNLQCYRDF